jgi:thiamine-phosphate pyrophosphorylase
MDHSENGCQLYLVIPANIDRDAVLEFVQAGLLSKISCMALQSDNDGKVDREFADILLRHAHDASIPLLLEDDIATAKELGTDGVHIVADEAIYAEARRSLGDDAIIGVECALSRHAGLTFAELGASYIAFSPDEDVVPDETAQSIEELISWWAETVTVPCVSWDLPTIESAQHLANAGSDFVALGHTIWSHPNSPVAATEELLGKLAEQQVSA